MFPFRRLRLVGVLSSLLLLGHLQLSAQFVEIEMLADVLDDAPSQPFFKIPELHAKDHALEVHLYMQEQRYVLGDDTVQLRSYTYKNGDEQSQSLGPWGPTLRVGANDRLTVIIHNNFSDGGDRNYLGSMNTKHEKLLVAGELSDELKALLIATSIPSSQPDKPVIKPGNLVGATLDVVEAGKKWVVHGKVECKCPPGKEGTCEKKPIEYPIVKMWNLGQQQTALRLYEDRHHIDGDDHNIPHGFNNTNLHTHGFHVSPLQDDIFRKVEPGESSYYTYDLKNHTPGTFWYHPHLHGSTALQVASGMSGIIIIEDGDLSKYPELAAASKPEHERLIMFNQIFYNKDINELPDFNTLVNNSGTPSGTTVNGKTIPSMTIEPGEVQRWRMVHSGYRSTLALQFPANVEVWQIAVDGIMFKTPRKLRTLHMAPGNRSDILIRVPKDTKPGSIDILSTKYNEDCEYFPDDLKCQLDLPEKPETIMKLLVGKKPQNMEFPKTLPGPAAGHEDITDKEIVNMDDPRKTTFNILPSPTPGGHSLFVVNGKAFENDTIHELLTLGQAEEWVVGSDLASHPYHIHINPFQVVKYGDRQVSPPIWKDVVLVTPSKDAIIRSRYQRYVGDFVMHCHLLHHEDQGMMQRIRIKEGK